MRFIINIIILLLTENTLNSQRLQINEIRLQSVEFVFKASTDCLKKSIIIKLFELYSFLFYFFFFYPNTTITVTAVLILLILLLCGTEWSTGAWWDWTNLQCRQGAETQLC